MYMQKILSPVGEEFQEFSMRLLTAPWNVLWGISESHRNLG